jgi:2'-5' RNA ligase
LGQSDDYQTSAAKKAITQIKKDPFDIKLQNISNFGKNIIYLNVTDSVILQDINQYLFDTLKKDFLLEDNRFSPHITLVRKPNLIPQDVDISPFDFTVSEIALMQSIRIEGELIYKPIFSHKL